MRNGSYKRGEGSFAPLPCFLGHVLKTPRLFAPVLILFGFFFVGEMYGIFRFVEA